jgi:hypothetical protein
MVLLLIFIDKVNGGNKMHTSVGSNVISTWEYSCYDAKYSIDVVMDTMGYSLVFYKHRFLRFPKFLLVKSYVTLEAGSAALKKYNRLFEDYTRMEEPFDVELLNEGE